MATSNNYSVTIKRYNSLDGWDIIRPITIGQNIYGSGTLATTPLLNSNDQVDSAFLTDYATLNDLPQGNVDVTINGTATATVQTLSNIIVGTTTYKNPTTFTGTSTTTGTPSGTTSVPTSYHLHDITLSGTRTTSGSGTTARRKLTITGSSSATSSTTSVASSGHNHTFTAQGSLS